jgi:septum site-determining protein MinC
LAQEEKSTFLNKKDKPVKEEKPAIRIKGSGNGLLITADATIPAANLTAELDDRLKRFNNLDENVPVTLDLGDKDKDGSLFKTLSTFLKKNFGIDVVSKPAIRQPLTKLADLPKKPHITPLEGDLNVYRANSQLLAGRVRSGQKIYTHTHLIILGDVNPGAEVSAGGDIIVLGSLRGTALAGQPNNDESVIIALDFRPTQIQIAGHVAAGQTSSPSNCVEIASVEPDGIVVYSYSEVNIFGKVPWPRMR